MARISIVEDRTDIRNGIKNLINSSEEHRCDNAFDSAEEAIKNINPGNTDLIFMDIELPGLSGIEATSRIKFLYPELQM